MRDFIHIDDIVPGSIKISKKIKNGDAINLSTGIHTNFINLAKIALNFLGKKNINEDIKKLSESIVNDSSNQ